MGGLAAVKGCREKGLGVYGFRALGFWERGAYGVRVLGFRVCRVFRA